MNCSVPTRLLAVVHPPERSGLHTFWGARWQALLDAGVEINLVLPDELVGFVPNGVPPHHVRYARLRRPRSQRNLGQNLAYLAYAHQDARTILDIAENAGSHLLVSHGPHYLTVALAARMSGLRYAVFIHSPAAPAWSARALSIIEQPAIVGYELPSTTAKYASLFRDSVSIQLAPVLDPSFYRGATPCAPSSRLRVGLVAAFSPRKRVDKFLDLVESHRATDLDFRLIGSVAGGHINWWESQIQPRVDRLARSGRLKVIDGSKGVADAMRDLDFLVITSDEEGIPNVAMEALSVGACVVSLELEGLAALRASLPEMARGAIRQVKRGDAEVDRIVAELQPENLLLRDTIANHVAEVTNPANAAKDIVTTLRALR